MNIIINWRTQYSKVEYTYNMWAWLFKAPLTVFQIKRGVKTWQGLAIWPDNLMENFELTIWRGPYLLTCCNSSLTPCLQNVYDSQDNFYFELETV